MRLPRRLGPAALLLPAMLALTGAPAAAQVSPAASMKTFEVAEGLEVSLFAHEPHLVNPTDIDVDAHGRVWVCEGVNYRKWSSLRPNGDRIVVLEDTDGDGKADKSTVFYEGKDVNSALGICVLGNKVIVSCSPNVFVFTDENGDLKADKKEVLFTNIKAVNHDHGVHAFVFGPDGKLYFNMGNDSQQIARPDGKWVVDAAGNEVRVNQKPHPASRSGPYRQGMVFRCNLDGSEFETLAWNFRNNYEVAVDSFGTMWQSDNDDDGNRGVRINYVMEFGNYGFTDEMTGAGWTVKRTNWESEIPLRHWHLNDPGVVPNLLQTGAGSPTGICVYEGSLLPRVFHNQVIHCDAGPNVVRAYPVEKDGAGYKATTVDIIKGGDRWFRPADVCVAPDGSLIVADWYDQGVGGHAMADNDPARVKGRIFRVAPPGAKWKVEPFDVSTPAGAVEALKSPNHARRHLAWTALNQMGEKAEAELLKLWKDPSPRQRARALHLLARIAGKESIYVHEGLKDGDADIRITALRIARERKLDVFAFAAKEYVSQLTSGRPDRQVLRECAIALRHSKSADAAALWVKLADHHDGKDRWYLEALGLAADRNEDAFLEEYLKAIGADEMVRTPRGRDLIWRSRARRTPELLARILSDPSVPAAERPRYLRAFDFLPRTPEREAALLALLKSDDVTVAGEALSRLKGSRDPAVAQATARVLEASKGTAEFVDLVELLNITDRNGDLLAIAVAKPTEQAAASAIRVLLKNNATDLIAAELGGKNAAALASALGSSSDKKVIELLATIVVDDKRDLAARHAASDALARSKAGGLKLLELIEQKDKSSYPTSLLSDVTRHLYTSTSKEVRDKARQVLPLPPTKDGKPLPAFEQLKEMTGEAGRGKAVFAANCIQCHQVNGEGTNFGPGLSEIGTKLGKDGLLTAILFPSAGIEHNYEGHLIRLRNGDELVGIIDSNTAEEIQLRTAGGVVQPIRKSDIRSDRVLKESIMPEDLAKTMTVQELVDVVEYMQTLKKK